MYRLINFIYSVIFSVAIKTAYAFEGLPNFAWPDSISPPNIENIKSNDCPNLNGLFNGEGDAFRSECKQGRCSELLLVGKEVYYPISAHPRLRKADREDNSIRWNESMPPSLAGKQKVFELRQSTPEEFYVRIPFLNNKEAIVTRYEEKAEDFHCSNGVLYFPPMTVTLGGERLSYNAGEERIAILRTKDEALLYLQFEKITRKIFFGLMPVDYEEKLELIRYQLMK